LKFYVKKSIVRNSEIVGQTVEEDKRHDRDE